jgi:hypothetical protein
MVRSATIGGIAAVRLGDRREARRLFALARGISPDVAKVWARWLVSCVPPLATRVWAVPDDPVESDEVEPDEVEPAVPPVDDTSSDDPVAAEPAK